MKNYIQVGLRIYDIDRDSNNYAQITSLSVDCKISNYLPEEEVYNFPIQKYVPTKGDKLYFVSGCNVPRIKLKDLALDYGVKSIRHIDEADVIVIGEGVKNAMYDYNWLYKLPVDIWKDFIDKHVDLLDAYEVDNINTALEHYPYDFVICEYDTRKVFENDDYIFYKDYKDRLVDYPYSSEKVMLLNDNYKNLQETLSATTAKIIDEIAILEYVNGTDAVIIDNTMYEQLCTMLDSSDEDNHILAMEIMANSN